MLRTWPRITILNNYSPKWYREGKGHDSQRGFIHFHPMYYLKGDRALGNSILRNSSSECQNQDQHSFIAVQTQTGTLYQMVSLKSSLWRQCVKMAVKYHLKKCWPWTFLSLFFLLPSAHSHFDYLNIFTCTSAVIGYPLRRYQEPLADIY